MTLSSEQHLTQLDAANLAPLVRQVPADDGAQLADCSFSRLPADAINPITEGIYRFTGMARCRDGPRPWSLILKRVRWTDLGDAGKDFIDAPADWNYWKRESLFYQSGIQDSWRGGLVSAKFLALWEPTPGTAWIWLKEVVEPNRSPWPVERHVLAARHFGEFNGAHVGYVPAAGDGREF